MFILTYHVYNRSTVQIEHNLHFLSWLNRELHVSLRHLKRNHIMLLLILFFHFPYFIVNSIYFITFLLFTKNMIFASKVDDRSDRSNLVQITSLISEVSNVSVAKVCCGGWKVSSFVLNQNESVTNCFKIFSNFLFYILCTKYR